MRKLWRRKWVVIPAAAVLILGVSGAAWALVAGDPATPAGTTPATVTAELALLSDRQQDSQLVGFSGLQAWGPALGWGAWGDGPECAEQWKDRLQRWKQQAERWKDRAELWRERAERCQAFLDQLREKMTAADRALYDRLTEQVKTQRESLQDAREALRDTLGQLRDLIDKYLESGRPAAPSDI